jgi:hypothetical protein
MFRALQRQIVLSLSAAVLTSLLVAGCQRGERARADVAGDATTVQQQVDHKADHRYNVATEDSYKMAMVRADSAHDVALQQCEALSGDARRQCTHQADADYEAARAHAKALGGSLTL